MKSKTRGFLFGLFLLLQGCLPLVGQETRGVVLGRVVDPSGAVIPGVKVTATNVATNVAITVESNAQGNYTLPYLLPGTYKLTAEAAGFKAFSRPSIEVRINDRIQVDIPMEIGDITEQVTITAETPLLQTSDASLGQVIDQQRVSDLPIAHGNPYLLMTLSPGVTYTQNAALDQPYAPTHIVGYTMAGVRANRSEITLDGTPNTVVNHRWGQGDLMVGYTPPSDVVQEMKMETTTFDASVGHTQGGITSVTLKTGSNAPHGTAYYAALNPVMDANLFFANQTGQPKAHYNYHHYGASLLGPVYIPKLYDGRNKTFFTFGYDEIRDSRPRGRFLTVPTDQELQGDFSRLLALGSQYQIYDPLTRVALPNGRYQEQPFGNNIIPPDRISSGAQAILSYWGKPNNPGTADGTNNLNATNVPEKLTYYNFVARTDHNFSDKHRMYGRFNTYKRGSTYYDYFNTLASGGVNNWPQHAVSLDDVYNFSPTTFMNIRYGFYRLSIGLTPKPESIGFDLTELGLPPSLNDAVSADSRAFPYINISGYSSSYNGWYTHNHQNHNLEVHLTSLKGNHTLKFGGDARDYRTFHVEPSNRSSGDFSFGTTYTLGPFDNSPSSPKGQGLATLLLGLPTGGGIQRNASYAEQSSEFSFYFQDETRRHSGLAV
jgi:hypothetical protein